jgi:hypothetical protein
VHPRTVRAVHARGRNGADLPREVCRRARRNCLRRLLGGRPQRVANGAPRASAAKRVMHHRKHTGVSVQRFRRHLGVEQSNRHRAGFAPRALCAQRRPSLIPLDQVHAGVHGQSRGAFVQRRQARARQPRPRIDDPWRVGVRVDEIRHERSHEAAKVVPLRAALRWPQLTGAGANHGKVLVGGAADGHAWLQ